MKRRWLPVVKVTVSLGLLAWVVHAATSRDGVGALAERVRGLNPAWLLAAVGLQLLAVLAGVYRWRALLAAQELPLPLPWLVRTFLVGRFVGSFTPSTTGLDLYRTVEVARRTGERGRSAGVIIVEKLVGLLGLALITVALLGLCGTQLLGPGALFGAAGVASLCGVGLAVLRWPGCVRGVTVRLPRRARELLDRVVSAVATRRVGVSVLGRCLGLSFLGHLATSGVFVTTALALDLPADPLAVLVVGNAIVVATLLPLSIGGVGVREGVAVMMLATVGVGPTDAALVALLGYLSGQVPALIGGIVSLAPAPQIAVNSGKSAATGASA